MPLEILTCATIGELQGGLVALAVDAEIRKAVADFADRYDEDEKDRIVNIQLIWKKASGVPLVEVVAQAKLPPYRCGGTAGQLRATAGGDLFEFQTSNPERADQPTLSDHLPKDEE